LAQASIGSSVLGFKGWHHKVAPRPSGSMAVKRVMMAAAFVVPVAAVDAVADANTSTLVNRSSSLRGSSALGSSSSASAACTASWAYNCNSNPTCCESGFTCFQKTSTWAACLKTCTPGIVQPGDDGKQIPWTCSVLGGGGPAPGTTPAPSWTTPPPTTPAPGQGCADAHQQCGRWAARGECSTNPDYMHQSCRLSCGLCQPCADENDRCAEWAARNQCAENPGYMNAKCKQSCGKCS